MCWALCCQPGTARAGWHRHVPVDEFWSCRRCTYIEDLHKDTMINDNRCIYIHIYIHIHDHTCEYMLYVYSILYHIVYYLFVIIDCFSFLSFTTGQKNTPKLYPEVDWWLHAAISEWNCMKQQERFYWGFKRVLRIKSRGRTDHWCLMGLGFGELCYVGYWDYCNAF